MNLTPPPLSPVRGDSEWRRQPGCGVLVESICCLGSLLCDLIYISEYPLSMLLSVVAVVSDLLSWWSQYRGAWAGDVRCNEAAAAGLTFVIRPSATSALSRQQDNIAVLLHTDNTNPAQGRS